MDWPADVIAAFRKGLTFTPKGDLKRDDLIIWVCEETARRAVWRARGNRFLSTENSMLRVGAKCQHFACDAGYRYRAHRIYVGAVFTDVAS